MKAKRSSKILFQYLVLLHTKVALITAISKRFKGSGLSDLIVSAGIIADKSVEKALRGKHYRRIVRVLQLTYEALQRCVIKHAIAGGVTRCNRIQIALETLKNPSAHSIQDMQKAEEDIKKSDDSKLHEYG